MCYRTLISNLVADSIINGEKTRLELAVFEANPFLLLRKLLIGVGVAARAAEALSRDRQLARARTSVLQLPAAARGARMPQTPVRRGQAGGHHAESRLRLHPAQAYAMQHA
jgi:hypothetical protein